MKNITLLSVILLTACSINVNAQNGFSELIKSGPADATRLFDAYSSPLFKGFGVGMNSGWNNTAKTNGKLKFELRITASGAFVPSSNKNFDVTKIGLSNHLRVAPGNQVTSPTIAGGNNRSTLEVYNDNNQKVDEFRLPAGKLSVMPAPQVQLTIGLIKNTDLALRGMPPINLGNDIGKVWMFGFGLKHNIMADLQGAGIPTPFDLALAFGFSRMRMDVPLDVQPEGNAQPLPGNTNNDFSNQHAQGRFNNFQIQALISKKFSKVTPFFSLGYNTSKTAITVTGNYPITTQTAAGQDFYETFTNPVSINKLYLNGLRADLGFQVDLSFFRIFGSYTAAQYQSVNAGIGFGF
ncbi:DUF6588 family protein [Mucilaginibacter litoreus]|uniref:DUF6588 family protein n=1 Tax=Mucilaginibacter litoreus TaxID=1048221 RepID=A0ABW3APT2_9SPHI